LDFHLTRLLSLTVRAQTAAAHAAAEQLLAISMQEKMPQKRLDISNDFKHRQLIFIEPATGSLGIFCPPRHETGPALPGRFHLSSFSDTARFFPDLLAR
jgi:hypothetical protein